MLIRSASGITIKVKPPEGGGGMTVVTAAQGDQFASWDEDAKHGLFTKHLLEALNGNSVNDSGRCSCRWRILQAMPRQTLARRT